MDFTTEGRRPLGGAGPYLELLKNCKSIDDLNAVFDEVVKIFSFTHFWMIHVANRPHVINRIFRTVTGNPPPSIDMLPNSAYVEGSKVLERMIETDDVVMWADVEQDYPDHPEFTRRVAMLREHGVTIGMIVPFRRYDGSTWGVVIGGNANSRTDARAILLLEAGARTYASRAAKLVGHEAVPINREAIGQLTSRQVEILKLLGKGHSNADIAHLTGLTTRGVEYLIGKAKQRMGSRTLAQLMVDVSGSPHWVLSSQKESVA